jgi:hypothetical protein
MAYEKKQKNEAVNVLTDPKELLRLKQVLIAITRDFQIIDDRKEAIKETVAEAATLYSVDKKLVRKLASVMYKSNYADIQEENDHFSLLYETLIDAKIRTKDPLDNGDQDFDLSEDDGSEDDESE